MVRACCGSEAGLGAAGTLGAKAGLGTAEAGLGQQEAGSGTAEAGLGTAGTLEGAAGSWVRATFNSSGVPMDESVLHLASCSRLKRSTVAGLSKAFATAPWFAVPCLAPAKNLLMASCVGLVNRPSPASQDHVNTQLVYDI